MKISNVVTSRLTSLIISGWFFIAPVRADIPVHQLEQELTPENTPEIKQTPTASFTEQSKDSVREAVGVESITETDLKFSLEVGGFNEWRADYFKVTGSYRRTRIKFAAPVPLQQSR